MKARIARTIVLVAAMLVLVLGIPLAIVTQRFYESRATVELQRSAAEAIVELTLPLRADEIASSAGEPDAPAGFSVYGQDGARLYGTGPDELSERHPDELVVVSPITDRSTETEVGSVRVSRPRSDIAAQARRAWALMALTAGVGLVLSVFVARREAARLAAPIAELAARAERLGSGEFDVSSTSTGTPELDILGDALAMSARRLTELLAREREFSANASHQLRTPLAGLRLSLERGDVVAAAVEADRLSATVDHMLALSRGALPAAEIVDVGAIVEVLSRRWRTVYAAADRSLGASIEPVLPGVRVRARSLEQTVDVLLENALRHGGGETHIVVRSAFGGVVVQVDDAGDGIAPERTSAVFDRHDGVSTG
ncbi:MAG: HAMP domain-containing sensor histidine kinase, partial [Ilumatobacteraceae bacterium]